MAARALLKRGVERGCGTQKEAARKLNYSPEMLNKILSGERNIASDIKPKMAQLHLMAGLALAQEATGYSWFEFLEGDRHPQNLLQRVLKEDSEADEALKPMGWRLIDKNQPEHLTPEDVMALNVAAKEMSHRIVAEINLLIEWEDRFHLGLLEHLTGKKEKSPDCVTTAPRANYNF